MKSPVTPIGPSGIYHDFDISRHMVQRADDMVKLGFAYLNPDGSIKNLPLGFVFLAGRRFTLDEVTKSTAIKGDLDAWIAMEGVDSNDIYGTLAEIGFYPTPAYFVPTDTFTGWYADFPAIQEWDTEKVWVGGALDDRPATGPLPGEPGSVSHGDVGTVPPSVKIEATNPKPEAAKNFGADVSGAGLAVGISHATPSPEKPVSKLTTADHEHLLFMASRAKSEATKAFYQRLFEALKP